MEDSEDRNWHIEGNGKSQGSVVERSIVQYFVDGGKAKLRLMIFAGAA